MKKLFILFLLCFIPSISFASEIFFSTDKNVFFQNEEFLAQVFLNTENITINALEGIVAFPAEFLELKEIRDGNSSVNFWIERPQSVAKGEVSFSGITAGGFSGPKIFLFGMVFQTKKMGNSSITFKNAQVLQNDGIGTKLSAKMIPFSFSISSKTTSDTKSGIPVIVDSDIPENFSPSVGSDPAIFDGKYFLVFATQDKGSGIDHYEIREELNSGFIIAESPYLLQNQKLDEKIFVKAVDKNGNERIVVIYPPNWQPWYKNNWIFGILILIILFVSYVVRKFYGKKF